MDGYLSSRTPLHALGHLKALSTLFTSKLQAAVFGLSIMETMIHHKVRERRNMIYSLTPTPPQGVPEVLRVEIGSDFS